METEIGKQYGRLVVVATQMVGRYRHALVKCECGNNKSVRLTSLHAGDTKSCGCLAREVAAVVKTRHGQCKDGKRTRLLNVHSSMIARCNNARHMAWRNYGGRGITVCDEWQDAAAFVAWALVNGYRDDCEIDRIDNSRGYSPDNCHFVSRIQNNNNRRNNVRLTLNGRTMTRAEWARETGLAFHAITGRMKLGWSDERILTTPSRKFKAAGAAK
jgi:hypothetical protein